MKIELPESIRGFIAQVPADQALEAVEKFLHHNLVSLDIGVFEEFDPLQFWSAERIRAEGRKAHSWFFLREWSSAAADLDKAARLELVQRLMEMHPIWGESISQNGSMAYHDETTAQRTMNISVFIRNYSEEIEELGFQDLCKQNLETIELLATEDFYGGENNHGMFQNIALLVAHGLGFANDTIESVAISRLTAYFDACFTEDGIHTENNPTYHVMVSKSLSQVTKYLKLTGKNHDPEKLEGLLKQADIFAGYCVLPNVEFPPISDTKIEKLSVQRARAIYGNGAFVGAITSGKHGRLPTSLTYIAEKSGYAIFRTGWKKSDSFAMLSAAYNANYHKHSDELSLYVYANGHALLSEAGPNGYQYSDPKTTYAFSSFAHNTLIVDGKGLPRVDGKSHLTTLRRINDLDVEGRTLRFDDVDWCRRVNAEHWISDGRLVITDKISSSRSHKFELLWHLGENTVPIVRGNAIEIFSSKTNEKIGELTVEGSSIDSVKPIYGQERPRVQGFSFPRMGHSVPSWVVQFEYNSEELEARWELRTRNFKILDRGITPRNDHWQTFYGEKPVRYLIDRPESADGSILFVFSAVSKLYDFTYNYRASLGGFPGAVCYIIDDFGDQGAYYLANNRNFAEFRSVQKAMIHIANQLGISLSDAYAVGSSKGGAAAIMHGVHAGIKHVIVGGPQYKIGSFTKTPHPNILAYISGGNDEEDIEWADKAMFEILSQGSRDTRISVFVGKADGHFKKHAVPLAQDAKDLGYDVDLLPLPGTSHGELGVVFRKVVSAVSFYVKDTNSTLPVAFTADPETMRVGLAVIPPHGALVLAQLQRDGKSIGKPVRVIDGVADWEVEQKGVYRARVYFEIPGLTDRVAFGTEPVRLA